MLALGTGGDTARGLTAGVGGELALVVLGLAGGGVDAGADVRPGAVVEGFFLAPGERGVGVLVEVGGDLHERG